MTVDIGCSVDALIEAYTQHSRKVRGLRDRTLQQQAAFARRFVHAVQAHGRVDPQHLRPCDVMTFVASLKKRFSPRSMRTVCSALRSFFRFLRVDGRCDERLEAAIPAVAYWRQSTVPRSLSDDQLVQVLASFDMSTRHGYRDRAIVMCLATLGLRPGEVASLRLEDVDWRAGIIQLHTRKTRRGAVLPLPREAGRALAAYLRQARPKTDARCVFVQHVGSRRGRPISSTAVSEVVVRALRRAKVDAPLSRAYVFRHTVTRRLVQHGANLKEIADFLGHRCLDTTTVYAKLDLPALRSVALPWPEVAL
ncbi:MAG: tyrosine-type recombinase/integrase [Acidobacteriota bacterium]|nr:tyrosine-type recombinase/integrase [Acidobacteriota bacterium]